MCNLYSETKGQKSIRDLVRATRDTTGSLVSLPGIYPDSLAPVVFTAHDDERELTMMRWGMPGFQGGAPLINIRNTASSYWRQWLAPAHRCLVPATSFCERQDVKPRKTPVWFALDETRPLFFFAGVWTNWHGTRGTQANPIHGWHRLYGILMTEANSIVGPIHPKAMPVVLTKPVELETWLSAPWQIARELQRPAPDDLLCIVARGNRIDGRL